MHPTTRASIVTLCLAGSTPGQVNEDLQLARTAVMRGNVEEARAIIDGVVRAQPDRVDALAVSAWVALRAGNSTGAAATIATALGKSSPSPWPLRLLAEEIRQKGDSEKKLQEALVARNANQWSEAAVLHEAAWRLDPWNGQALLDALQDWQRADSIDAQVALLAKQTEQAPELGPGTVPQLQDVAAAVTARAKATAAELIVKAR